MTFDLNHLLSIVLVIAQEQAWLGYATGFFVSLFDSFPFIGYLIPGTFPLLILGWLSQQGSLSFTWLTIITSLGSIISDWVGYYVGSKGHIVFKEGNRVFKLEYLTAGKSFFSRYGAISVLLGRFIGPLRPVVAFVAGVCHMPKGIFWFYNLLGAIGWNISMLALGYWFGEFIGQIIPWIRRGEKTFLGLLILIFITWILKILIDRYWLKSKSAPDNSAAEVACPTPKADHH